LSGTGSVGGRLQKSGLGMFIAPVNKYKDDDSASVNARRKPLHGMFFSFSTRWKSKLKNNDRWEQWIHWFGILQIVVPNSLSTWIMVECRDPLLCRKYCISRSSWSHDCVKCLCYDMRFWYNPAFYRYDVKFGPRWKGYSRFSKYCLFSTG
jgi:hypothetical protein